MSLWNLFVYEPDDETDPFGDWLRDQDAGVRAEFDAALVILLSEPDWEDEDLEEFKVLTGRDVGLSAIRFRVIEKQGKKRNIRVLGIYLPLEHEFVMLVGFEKTGRDNRNVFDYAQTLKKQYFQRRGECREYFK